MKASRTVKCKNCGKEIAIEATRCPDCGGYNFSSWIMVASVIVLVGLVFFFLTGGFGLI